MAAGINLRAAAKEVADMLCQDGTLDDDKFFGLLVDEMNKQGYTLECNQLGIRGTHIVVRKAD